jgi:hypothetical protein
MSLRTFLVGTAAFFVIGAGSIEASTISFDYTYNPADVFINNNGDALCTGSTTANTVSSTDCESLAFTYTLAGYNSLTDVLSTGTLTLTFYDDNEPRPDRTGTLTETVNISLDGLLTGNSPLLITSGSTATTPFDSQFGVLAQLQDGALTILLSLPAVGEGNNDFFFAASQLVAEGTRTDPTLVPEPATLTLFGAGVAAAALRRRRRT